MITKSIQLGDQTITVRELTVREIKKITASAEGSPVDAVIEMLTTCTTATPEMLEQFAPSDIDPLVEKMIEVNTPFLTQLRRVHMVEAAESLEGLFRSVCSMAFLT